MLLLVACTDPPLLGSVAEKHAADAVAEAEPAMRLFWAAAGVLAETCPVTTVEGHYLTGPAAIALGIDGPVVKRATDTGTIYWTFEPVGIDGEQGKLVYETDSTRQSFTAVYTGPTYILDATYGMAFCDEAYHSARPSGPPRPPETGGRETGQPVDTGDSGDTGVVDVGDIEAIVSGSGTFTKVATEETTTVSALGSEPYPGLAWTPPDARLPIAGFLRWVSADEDTKITLDDAGVMPSGAIGWPGHAASTKWEGDVMVDTL